MTAPKHTPGPWTVYAVDGGCEIRERKSFGTGETLARITPTKSNDWVQAARLIAAAPDLLIACERFIRAQDENDRNGLTSAAMLASAAIAKARGEA